MSRLADLPLLPVQALGSAAAPPWVWLLRDAVGEGALGPSDIAESLHDAARIALLDQAEAGYDIVSDGEMLRADFTRNFHGHIRGLEPIEYERRLGYPGPDQLDAFRAVSPIAAPDGLRTGGRDAGDAGADRPSLRDPPAGAGDAGLPHRSRGRLCRQGQGGLGAGAGHQPRAEGGRGGRRPPGADRRAGLLDHARRAAGDGRYRQCLHRGRGGDDLAAPVLRQLPRPARDRLPLVRCLRAALRRPRLRRAEPGVRQPLHVAGRPVGRARSRQGPGGRRHRRQGPRCRDAGDRGRAHPPAAAVGGAARSCGSPRTVATARPRGHWQSTRCAHSPPRRARCARSWLAEPWCRRAVRRSRRRGPAPPPWRWRPTPTGAAGRSGRWRCPS